MGEQGKYSVQSMGTAFIAQAFTISMPGNPAFLQYFVCVHMQWPFLLSLKKKIETKKFILADN